jgi:hypothetical protein
MKVEYLFSRNKAWGSCLIAWAAKYEDLPHLDNGLPSHGAVLLDGLWVFESTMASGVRVVPYSEWLKINEQLYRIPCPEKRTSKEVLKLAAELWGSSYDFAGISFFGWRYLGLILTGRALPSVNRWENPLKHFCTEFMAKLWGKNLSMWSPAKTCSYLLEVTNDN